MIYRACIESILLYGVEIWGHAGMKPGNLGLLDGVNILAARGICRASKTSANIAVLALAGLPPMDLKLRATVAQRWICTPHLRDHLKGDHGWARPHWAFAKTCVEDCGLDLELEYDDKERMRLSSCHTKCCLKFDPEPESSRPDSVTLVSWLIGLVAGWLMVGSWLALGWIFWLVPLWQLAQGVCQCMLTV